MGHYGIMLSKILRNVKDVEMAHKKYANKVCVFITIFLTAVNYMSVLKTLEST